MIITAGVFQIFMTASSVGSGPGYTSVTAALIEKNGKGLCCLQMMPLRGIPPGIPRRKT